MVIYNGDIDPYHPESSRYECRSCGARSNGGGVCDSCGSESVINIAVPRE